jgi:hypothetical protein
VNVLPPLPGQPLPAGGSLHTRRCVRHDSREAAARCPGCRREFCRECVVDHAGRLLCSGCITKLVHPTGVAPRRWAVVRRGLATGAGVMVAWVAFFWVGTLLLKIPAAVHEGTIWKMDSSEDAR